MMRANPITARLRRILVGLLLVGMIPPAVWFARRQQTQLTVRRSYQAAQWVVGDRVALRADAPPQTRSEVWDGKTIRLAGMRNEVVAFQLAVRPAYFVNDARLELTPFHAGGTVLAHDGHYEALQARLLDVRFASTVAGNVPVAESLGPGRYPCQLEPLPASGLVDLPVGEVSSLWVDYWIPPDAAPGLYRAELRLQDDRSTKLAYPIELRVWNLDMPRDTHCRNWFVLDTEQLSSYLRHDPTVARELRRGLTRMAQRHRAWALAALEIGDPEFQFFPWWTEHGALLSGLTFQDGPCARAKPTCIPLSLPSKVTPTAAREILLRLTDGLRQRDVLQRCVLTEPTPRDEAGFAWLRQRGVMINEYVGATLPLLASTPVTPPERSGSLLGLVDVFCVDRISDSERRQVAATGAKVWANDGALAGRPVIDAPLLGVVAWAPAVFRYHLDGQRIWNVAYWRQKEYGVESTTDMWNDPLTIDEAVRVTEGGEAYPADWAMRLNGDGVWIYPGVDTSSAMLLPSLRLKAWRRGAQDYEYLWLLRGKGRAKAADAFAARLVPRAGSWEADPAVWEKTRREMAAMLLELKKQ